MLGYIYNTLSGEVIKMDFGSARENMIECQLRTNKITDNRILEVMSLLPRERFVPQPFQEMAYVDTDIPCGVGRYLMSAMASARLIQEADIQSGDEVLCVGAGTGYSTAVMAGLAASVIALESEESCAQMASRLFSDLNLDNSVVVEGVLTSGWNAESPYNVILIDGMIEEVPTVIFEQLSNRGRMVTVVDSGNGIGIAKVFVKLDNRVTSREIFNVKAGKLPEFKKKPGFVF